MSVFVVYAYAIRDLINSGKIDLTNEGLFWFKDLSSADETFILPLLAVAGSYSLVQLGIKGRKQPKKKLIKLSDSKPNTKNLSKTTPKSEEVVSSVQVQHN